MRFSVGATMIAATNPSALAASSIEDSSSPGSASIAEDPLAGDGGNNGNVNPSARSYRTHWTMPHETAKVGEDFPHHLPSKPVLLTNKKTTKEEGIGSDTPQYKENDTQFDEDGGDIGILSPSRRLAPLLETENDGLINVGRPDSDVFESFTLFDRDRTAFYSICDPTVEDEYLCFRCDSDSEERTVSNFDCQKISCYEIDSRCPNNKMVVCRYDTLKRTFEYEPSDNAAVPYESEKCRRIQTNLTKTDRAMLPNEESSWDFTYCLRYNINSLLEDGDTQEEESSSPNTCQMEIDGFVCTSCSLTTVEFLLDASSNSTNGALTQQEFCVNFDCGNTLLGHSGSFCNDAGLATSSLDYFVYRSLPCDGGCNLCGEADPFQMMMMEFRYSYFDTPRITNDTEDLNTVGLPASMNCFKAQWDALMGGGLICSDLQDSVEKSCGCTPMGSTSPVSIPVSNSSSSDDSENGGDDVDASNAMLAQTKSVQTILVSLAVALLTGCGFV